MIIAPFQELKYRKMSDIYSMIINQDNRKNIMKFNLQLCDYCLYSGISGVIAKINPEHMKKCILYGINEPFTQKQKEFTEAVDQICKVMKTGIEESGYFFVQQSIVR